MLSVVSEAIAPAKPADKAAETPEYIRQKALCEHHKKVAFDTTRCMFEEELIAFRADS